MQKFIEPPDAESYSLGERSQYTSIALPGGPPRVRNKILGAWQPLNVSWSFDREGYRYFQSFYQGLIADGFDAFLLDLLLAKGELVEHTVKFVPNSLNVSFSGDVFRVSHSLIVKPNLEDDDGGAFFDAL